MPRAAKANYPPGKARRGRPPKESNKSSGLDANFDIYQIQLESDLQTIQQPVQEKRTPGRPRKNAAAMSDPKQPSHGKKVIVNMLRDGVLIPGHKLFFAVSGFVFVATIDDKGFLHDPILGMGYNSPSAWASAAASRVSCKNLARASSIENITLFHRYAQINFKTLQNLYKSDYPPEHKRCLPEEDTLCAHFEIRRLIFIPRAPIADATVNASQLSEFAPGKAVIPYEDYLYSTNLFRAQIAALERDLENAKSLLGQESVFSIPPPPPLLTIPLPPEDQRQAPSPSHLGRPRNAKELCHQIPFVDASTLPESHQDEEEKQKNYDSIMQSENLDEVSLIMQKIVSNLTKS